MLSFRGPSSGPEPLLPANVGVTCHANEPLRPPASELPPIWTNCGLTPRFPELVQRAMKRADKRAAKSEAFQRQLGDTALSLASTARADASASLDASGTGGGWTARGGRERPPATNRATLYRAVYSFERYHNAARAEVLDPRAKQQLLDAHLRAQSRSTMAPSRHALNGSRHASRRLATGASRRSARATATPHTVRSTQSRRSAAPPPVPALDLSAARTVRDQFLRARPKTPMDAYLQDDTLELTPRQYLLLSQEHDAQLSALR